MDSSDEDEFHDASDAALEPHEEEKSPAAPPPDDVSTPGDVKVLCVGKDVVSVTLTPTSPAGCTKLNMEYSSSSGRCTLLTEDSGSVQIKGLHPGTEYLLCIAKRAENGGQREAVRLSFITEPIPPEKITVCHVSSESVTLQWDAPAGEVHSYLTTCSCGGDIMEKEVLGTNSVTFSGLKPGAHFLIEVCAQLKNGSKSKPAMVLAKTKTILESLLADMGLEQYYPAKLSLGEVLQIDEKTITDQHVKCNADRPLYLLKKLMMVNVTGRSVKCISASESNFEAKSENQTVLDLSTLENNPNEDDMLNPLDIITALFLCADSFVQQEMALKLSMCQFSVPLLLPNAATNQCTLMLWAMRDIVKKYRPQSLSESKGFVEDRIVLSELPLISFVRLGECSLSKSEILNKLLCNSQQYHDTFVHHNMDCGDSPRRLSNGLTEITWYLPCGNKNMDIFNEPIAVANLRGDIASFETQYSFLCQTSTAVFVFFDSMDPECKLLTNQNQGAQIFLVGNHQSKDFNLDAVHKVASELGLNNNSIILKTKRLNDADLVKSLRRSVRDVAQNSQRKIPIEQMAKIAHEVGIAVDEDSPECQRAKKNADAITTEIQDNLKYKETHLPLQGQIWKDLTCLEKEEFRLRKVGSKDVELYKSELQEEKKKLRERQNSDSLSHAMIYFISAISSPGSERCYFLKWMRMNLDNLSREKLTDLREQYKKKCENKENKEEIKELDIKLSNSSLGTEHFFREMGQIYEALVALPETHPSRRQFDHLPKLCAELLLDGFPLEIVDGDASNIPLRWVRDVLSQLNDLVAPKNKILVITVLGVQSTGKSTLLNTMFGVQFSVSSGRCTRGAFMLLIRVNEDVKKELNCDYMVIIDTEGLKSPELAQLDDSHEHDNELATLVVGLSDVTIINIAMENLTEMKDILQIVVHAFLRMKEIGKKHKCQFVHQNVSDVSAHEKNLRDRKLLLQQLNEMTQAAAKMEKKEENKSFTDVMEYNPDTGNWYVPGLWNGNPPMAPVNAGYSEAVYELKKNIIRMLGNCASSSNNILEFTEWMSSLWNAVKNENFIFSFRNSLVADAYMRLCTEFNKWEWDFKKDMYSWVTKAETRISNVGTAAEQSETSDIDGLLSSLKGEASTELSKWERKLLDNLTNYFKQTEGHVYLVEGYREDFANSAKSLRREMESSIINQLTAAAEIKQGMSKVDNIKKNHTKELEGRVCALIEECRKKKRKMKDDELDKEFDKMWAQTVKELTYSKQKASNVFTRVFHNLRDNVGHKGGASQLLNAKNLQDCGLESFTHDHGLWVDIKHQASKLLHVESHKVAVKKMADSIIAACKQFVCEKVERKTNYHNTYTEELLNMIDEKLRSNAELKTDINFEVSLKQHICGDAARKFQKMHEDFIHGNDPHICLNQNKDKFRADFKDVFHKRDQCQKKAQEFTNRCLRPAVEEFVNCSLGPDIIGEMKTQKQFSTRTCFQEALVKDLHSKDTFQSYLSYISSYEEYVKTWIFDQILQHFTTSCKVSKFEDQHIHSCISSINTAIEKANTRKSGNLQTFVEDICKELVDKLKLRQDVIDAFMILNNANHEQFAKWLTEAVIEMGKSLQKKFQGSNIQTKLENLSIKPQNELFTELIGCGKQCPFCKAPCDAGGQKHTEHFAKLHRPIGLGRYRFEKSEKLVTDICTSLVVTDRRFRCLQTSFEYHPYKQYKEIFPDWSIPADASYEASDYWKYVLAKFNDKFAKEYNAKPADIPPAWRTISRDQADASIKISFNT